MNKEVVADGTEWGSPEWYDNRWKAIPEDQQRGIVDFLQKNLDSNVLTKIKEEHSKDPSNWGAKYHMFSGMGVRNLLRDIMKDDELPLAPYPDGMSFSHWDDYYIQALEAAAGVREI